MSHIKEGLKQYHDEYSKYSKYDGMLIGDVMDMLEQLQDDLEQDEKGTGRLRTLSEIQEDIRTLTRVPSEFIHAKLDELANEIGELVNNRWINAEDGKPKDGVYVFAVLKHTYESDYTDYSVARYIELSDGNSYWYDNKHGYLEHPIYTNGNGGSSLYKVVAWKPIEPYKED